MPSEDITFCMSDRCEYMKCIRNPKHIKLPIPHSYAWFEGTNECPVTKVENINDK